MEASAQPQTKVLISHNAYIITTSIFLAIAILAATARIYIRIHIFKRVTVDDYFFFLAVAALITAAGLSFASIEVQYLALSVVQGTLMPPPNLTSRLEHAASYAFAAEVLHWTVILAVKFSFLFYFRALVDRLYRMKTWWWIVLIAMTPIAVFSIAGFFIVCPHGGRAVFQNCSPNPSFLRRERAFVYFTVVADIVSDFMLISIPVIVARQVSLNLRRKLSIGVVLCLSLFMVIFALIRGISIDTVGLEDETWTFLWFQLEACISVIAACPTAFRSLFLAENPSINTRHGIFHIREQSAVVAKLWTKTKLKLPRSKIWTELESNGRIESPSPDENSNSILGDLKHSTVRMYESV